MGSEMCIRDRSHAQRQMQRTEPRYISKSSFLLLPKEKKILMFSSSIFFFKTGKVHCSDCFECYETRKDLDQHIQLTHTNPWCGIAHTHSEVHQSFSDMDSAKAFTLAQEKFSLLLEVNNCIWKILHS